MGIKYILSSIEQTSNVLDVMYSIWSIIIYLIMATSIFTMSISDIASDKVLDEAIVLVIKSTHQFPKLDTVPVP